MDCCMMSLIYNCLRSTPFTCFPAKVMSLVFNMNLEVKVLNVASTSYSKTVVTVVLQAGAA